MKEITIEERYRIRQIDDEEPEPGPGHYRNYNQQLEGKEVSFTKDRRGKFADNMIPGPSSYGKIQDWAHGYKYEMSIPAAAFDEKKHYKANTLPLSRFPKSDIKSQRFQDTAHRVDREPEEQKYNIEQENKKVIISKNVIAEETKETPSFDVDDDVVARTYSPAKTESKVVASGPSQTVTKMVKTSGKTAESESPSKTSTQKYSASKTAAESKTTAYAKTCKL